MSRSGGENETVDFRVFAVGDIFPADHYFMIGHGLGSGLQNGSIQMPMSVLTQLISETDIAICNLEAPLCESSTCRTSYAKKSFRGYPRFAKELSNAGFSLVNIANNHIMQHGLTAFTETISAITEEGISILGLAGDNGYCSKPIYIPKGDRLVCILGYSIVDDPYCESPRPYAHGSPERILRDVSRMDGQCDILVVSIHGGPEGSPIPDRFQRNLFRKIAEKGADVVIGHHSHVVQPMERHRGSAIFYSLGNFLFDLPWFPESEEGAIAQVRFGNDGKVSDARLIGTQINEATCVELLKCDGLKHFDERLIAIGRSLSLPDQDYDDLVKRENATIAKRLQVDKIVFFMKNIWKGNTREKIKFLFDKIVPR